MVRSRADEIRQRIARRRKNMGRSESIPEPESLFPLPAEEEKYGFDQIISFEGDVKDEGVHPLFRKEVFFFKILASACLFLVIAILFRNHSAALEPTRNLVKKTMDTEFQFAAVTNWYEKKFGKPLALLPFNEKKRENNINTASSPQYAIPASGRVLENFQKNGQGVMIETTKATQVKAMNEGIVRFSGVKEGLGKTVIIQHSDQTESWYGNLEKVNVNLYEYIEKGKEIGTVSPSSANQTKGEFYFAIKKGDHFIDPIQVIRLE